jgi:hypothetical protein
MPQKSRSAVWVAVVIFIAIALGLRLFGGPIYHALLAMHGRH